ncbi:MAG: hypothetical protein D6805_01345 [Planctomycetota bacterium]|nr:MAG: hypothetical protein D6805_01345 [Planctomycetota bacterium]
MSYLAYKHLHIFLAFVLATYAVFLFWWEWYWKRQGEERQRSLNQKLLYFQRVANWVGLLTGLVGLKIALAGKWFQLGFAGGGGWVHLKPLLFLALLGVMGAFGSKAAKLRREAFACQEGDERNKIFDKAQRKMNIFLYSQFILILLIFYLAYLRPF